MKRNRQAWLWALATAASLVAIVPKAPQGASDVQQSDFERLAASCSAFHSYLVTTLFAEARSAQPRLTGPAIIAFRDQPDGDDGDPIVLATQDQVGAVYGLGYDAVRGRLYAAAYHKRSTAFGPGGPRAIYEIDLASGQVRPFVRLGEEVDRHNYSVERDEPAARWVGQSSLGDLDVDEEGSQLFVTNLSDGQIYRIRLPDGAILGAFRHGAAEKPWARSARPFGLAYAGGWLYHGVVNSLASGGSPPDLRAYIYRSRPDGSELSPVAEFGLRYPRGWQGAWGWAGWDNQVPNPWPSGQYPAHSSQPMLADLELLPGGQLVIGLRDRMADMLPTLDRPSDFYRGVGDILLGLPVGTGWRVATDAEHFVDEALLDESMWGSLASLPGFDLTVGASLAPHTYDGLGALWHVADSGRIFNAETVVGSYVAVGSNGLGDIESLCPRRRQPDPQAVATATAAAATATFREQATGTAIAQTTATAEAAATATLGALIRTPTPIMTLPPDLPQLVAESCQTDNPFAATVCHPYLGWSPTLSLPWEVMDFSVFAFRDTPKDAPVYAIGSWAIGALWGLAYRSADATLYAAAYHKRLAAFGPLGPGGIYRIPLASGEAEPLCTVPDAGPNVHPVIEYHGADTAGRDWVGKVGLGDIDLSDDETQFFVMNLYNRRIYRFEATTCRLIDSFDHGAAKEPWAADARPFALKYHRGKLYHGVVNSAERSRRRAELAAYVYESEPDGSGMRQVARVPLTYDRGTVRVPPVFGGREGPVSLDWLPWRGGDNDLAAARVMISIYPQPMLTDIEFRPNEDMILGLRDRHADMSHGYQVLEPTIQKPGVGFGDVLLVPRVADGWGEAIYGHFQNLGGVSGGRAGMGGLAGYLKFPFVLTNRAALNAAPDPTGWTYVFREVLWYDLDGNPVRSEDPCSAAPYGRPQQAWIGQSALPRAAPKAMARVLHNEYQAGRSMGDIEILCGPSPTPTSSPSMPTPTLTATPHPTATARRTPTPSVTPTASPTATPGPRQVYLPIGLRIPCISTGRYSDVALVIDVSTSMSRLTPSGRSKLAATIDAAHWLVDRMEHLAADALGNHEQVAVVGFNCDAWLEQELTNDRAALHAALDRLTLRVAQYTRLDLAVTVGAAATGGQKHRPANGKVIILLTDGLPNQVPLDPDGTMNTTVLKAAQAAKEAGNRIYTIAIGAPEDTDPALLQGMASGPDHYYYMPDPEDLELVYGQIYSLIPCANTGVRWP